MNTFLQQGCIKLIKRDREDIDNATNVSISNKCFSFKLSSSKNPEICVS